MRDDAVEFIIFNGKMIRKTYEKVSTVAMPLLSSNFRENDFGQVYR